MKRLLCIAAALALAAAKPEMYKETEDFQYQRSSTDEGTKSGFYGAQRGNMGGNYERAHNMDGLAQNQMSGAVSQVEGELGDATNTRTGTVFTAANSRGVYGAGRYDLSNLQGRNFQENLNYGDSHSQSSHSSDYRHQSSYDRHNAAYNSDSLSSGYKGYHGNNYAQLNTGNLQTEDRTQDAGVYDYGRANSHSQGYHTQSGHESHSSYGSSSANNAASYRVNPQSRLIVTTPVRVYTRPGSRVAIPVGVQTYDATHSASTLDQNAINSDAETFGTAYKPTSHAKGYESSYSYRKQWEKHDAKPEIVVLSPTTDNPYPKNSELYDDAQLHVNGMDSQSAYSSGYNSNTKSSSSQSRYQSAAESQSSSSSAHSNSNSYNNGAYNSGASADTTNVLGNTDSKPKSYQSSYSYHKSWERQGDPYEIKPVGGAYAGQASERLSSASHNQGYSSHQYDARHHQSHQGYTVGGIDCDCDENGHIRVARSADTQQRQTDDFRNGQIQEDLQELQQQTRNGWENFRNGARQNQRHYSQDRSGKLEDLGHEQSSWDHRGDVGQQTQNLNTFSQVEQQGANRWEQQEDLGQQTQELNNLENLQQETQNNWNFDQQTNRWDQLNVGQNRNSWRRSK